MIDQSLLLEMSIVGFIGIVSIVFGLFLFVRHLHDKDWNIARPVILTSTISVSIMATIFEIVWFCMYLGLSV